MAYNYAALAARARKSIAKFGQTVTLKRVTEGTYNTATGTQTASTSDYAAEAVVVDYEERLIDGSVIRRGDRKALLAASGLSVEPVPGDKLAVGATTYQVVNAMAVNPGGTAVVYELQVRA